MEKLRREYGSNASPDDVRHRPEVESFMQEFKEMDPMRVPDEDGETDNYSSPWDEIVEVQDREYGLPRPAPPLTVDDSAKFGGSAKPMIWLDFIDGTTLVWAQYSIVVVLWPSLSYLNT